ncbi:hypothetical protein [Acinetobacter sp. YH12085]|uniref:hypothetical protein n=1 Tax=Acinetobacter sp. YH12085 TaxID=2601077 RepID=UPI0015D1CA6E|nr:hypothetical protein [Acinetobacter sp. YH12085]
MNKKILKRVLLGAWFIFLFYVLFIPNKVHREGMVDQEQLSNKLFGAYSSHRYEEGLNKERSLSGYAFIDKKELSKQDLNYKVADLKKHGWKQVYPPLEDQTTLCFGSQNRIIIVYPTKLSYSSGMKLTEADLATWIVNYTYAYKGARYC